MSDSHITIDDDDGYCLLRSLSERRKSHSVVTATLLRHRLVRTLSVIGHAITLSRYGLAALRAASRRHTQACHGYAMSEYVC